MSSDIIYGQCVHCGGSLVAGHKCSYMDSHFFPDGNVPETTSKKQDMLAARVLELEGRFNTDTLSINKLKGQNIWMADKIEELKCELAEVKRITGFKVVV